MSSINTSFGRTSLISDSNQLLFQLRRTQNELFRKQTEISTGKRVIKPSDDASNASSLLLLNKRLKARAQEESNLGNALSLLNNVDSSIGEAFNIALEARDIASSQIGVGSDEVTRANQATVINEQLRAMIEIANRQVLGLSIFGGNNGAAAGDEVFEEFLGGVRYLGSDDDLATDIGFVRPLDFTSNGISAFGSLSSRVQSEVDLNPDATAQTRVVDVNGAANRGVTLGAVQLNVNGTAANVDLTGAETLGDVVTRINNAIDTIDNTAGGLAVSGDGFELTAAAGSTITISDIGTGITAEDLGIDITATGATTAGGDIDTKVTLLTNVADLGIAIDFASGLKITQGEQTKVADFSSATTIEDMINVVDQLQLGLRLEVNQAGDGINLISEVSGIELSIGENAGGTTATDLGLRTLDGTTALGAFRDGLGVNPQTGKDDVRITLHDGTSFDVNLDGSATVQDVLDAISAAATTAGVSVSTIGDGASDFNVGFVDDGNGIRFEDNTAGATDFAVTKLNESLAADHLGITGNAGAGTSIDSDDNAKVRVESIFTDLMRLRDSLEENNELGITVAGTNLEASLDRLTRARADVGVRAQRVELQVERSQELGIMEQAMRSELQDADLTEVITRFQQLQVQLQASLQAASARSQLSFLDFI